MTPDEAAAEVLARASAEVGDVLPIDVELIATELELLHVQERANLSRLPGIDAPPGVELSGLLVPGEKRIWVEAVEAARSPGRRRFTVAHELGHWLLHHLPRKRRTPIFCRPADVGAANRFQLEDASRMEREANRFAASLLMPEPHVRREAHALVVSVPALARRFGVSAQAMQLRLEGLDVLPDYMR